MLVWVLGAQGMLGSSVCNLLSRKGIRYVGTNKQQADITNIESLEFIATRYPCTHVINCSAYTSVEEAEKNPASCYAINEWGTYNVAIVARKYNMHGTHISTDYVFPGNRSVPYTETDVPLPNNHYGLSKYLGEKKWLETCTTGCLVRTSWLFGYSGLHFIQKIWRKLQLQKTVDIVSDQIGRLTFCDDLAEILVRLFRHSGIFHFANAGVVSWYDVGHYVWKRGRVSQDFICKKLVPVRSVDNSSCVRRPLYSVLSTTKVECTLSLFIRSWKATVDEYLQEHFLKKDTK
jgi:dTDP-4-dehydrorhamnose reductase